MGSATGTTKKVTLGTLATWIASYLGLGDKSVRAFRTASTALTAGTWATLAFDNESYDTDTMHDNVTNNTRITFTTAGKYLVTGCGRFTTNATHGLRIRLNGATELAVITHGNSSANPEGSTISLLYQFSAGDYIELQAWSANTSISVTSAEFAAQKLA